MRVGFENISVLIPVYNEECVLAETIDALRVAGFPDANVYVVNDQSTDRTEEIARSLGVNVVTVPVNGGKARAQRYALNHFDLTNRYDWVIFLDGDTKVHPDFGFQMIKAAQEHPEVSLLVGQVASAKNSHLFSAYRAYDYTWSQELIKKGQDNFNVVYVSPGCASMYRSEMLAKLDIDASTLAEDMDLTIQVHRHGGKVKYVHDALVITQDPNSFKDYVKQTTRWKRGFWQITRKHNVFGFCKKQPVDLYMIYITLESLILNRFVLMAITALTLTPFAVVFASLIDFAIFCLIGLYSAAKTRRVDILIKMPVFYWLSYVNLYVHLKTFVEIVVLHKNILAWNKVQRYQFSEQGV